MFIVKSMAALAALCASATIAHAGEYTFVVDKSELSTSAGLERTAKRIERTAKSVCGVEEVRGVARTKAAKECEAGVADHILAGIDSPELANLHRDTIVYASR